MFFSFSSATRSDRQDKGRAERGMQVQSEDLFLGAA